MLLIRIKAFHILLSMTIYKSRSFFFLSKEVLSHTGDLLSTPSCMIVISANKFIQKKREKKQEK